MPGKMYETEYRIDGNAKGMTAATELAIKGLKKLRSEGDRSARSAKRFTQSANRQAGSLRGLGIAASNAKSLLAGFTVGLGLERLTALTDQYDDLQARLRVVTDSTEEYVHAQSAVLQIANETFLSLRGTTDLYARLEISLDDVAVSQERVLGLTRSVNQAFQVSGATTQESAAAAIQLAQGLAAGALRGDEFRSVSEQGVRILKALRDGLGKTQGELREMANAGQLTTEVVLKAIEDQSESIQKEFNELPLTMGRATQQLQNEFVNMLGEMNKTVPVVRGLANSVQFLAQNLATVITTSAAVGLAWKLNLIGNGTKVLGLVKVLGVQVTALAFAEKVLATSTIGLSGAFATLQIALVNTLKVIATLSITIGRLALAAAPAAAAIAALAFAAKKLYDLTAPIDSAVEGTKELIENLIEIARTSDEIATKEVQAGIIAGQEKLNDLLEEQAKLEEQIAARKALASVKGVSAGGGAFAFAQLNAGADSVAHLEAQLQKSTEASDELSASLVLTGLSTGRVFASLEATFGGLASTLTGVGDSIPQLGQLISEGTLLGQVFSTTAERIREMRSAQEDSEIGSFADDIMRLRGELDPVAKATSVFHKEVDKLRKELDKAKGKGLAGFNLAVKAAAANLRAALLALQDNTAELEAMAAAQQKLIDMTLALRAAQDPLLNLAVDYAEKLKTANEAYQLAGEEYLPIYTQLTQELNAEYQAQVKALKLASQQNTSYNKTLEKLFSVVTPTKENLTELAVAIEAATEAEGAQGPATLMLIELMERLQMAYAGVAAEAKNLTEVQRGIFGGEGADQINTFPELLARAFDNAGKSGSFKDFFKDIVKGFKDAADQGGEELATALNSAAQFAAFAVDNFRNNPDAPLRAIAETAAAIPGIVGQVAQAVQAVDSIFGGRLLGTNYEATGSGRNITFGSGGAGGSSFLDEERQRSFFRGTARRRTESDLDPQVQQQLDQFFEQVAEAMGASARELGVNVPMMIAGEFAETFDADGELVSSVSTVLGRTFSEGFEQFTQRVLAENIIAVISQAVGDVEVPQQQTARSYGFDREDLFGGYGGDLDQVLSQTTVLMNEAQAIAERWRDDAEMLLEGAQFLLLAQSRIQDGLGLLLDEGGLTATTDLVEELAFAGENLSDTFLRLVASVDSTQVVFDLFEAQFDGTREAFVRFSDDLVQAAGGVDRLRVLFKDVLDFFFSPEEALDFQLRGATESRDTQFADLGIDTDTTAEAFRQILSDAINGAADPETIAALLEAGSAMALVAEIEQQIADIRLEALEEQQEALLAQREALQDIMRSVGDRLAATTLTGFQQAVRNLATDLEDMTTAARAAGASASDLAEINITIAREFQQLVDELRLDSLDLAAQLFGTPLEEIESRIASIESRRSTTSNIGSELDKLFDQWMKGLKDIQEFLDELLLDETRSPLTPSERIAEAQRQFEETLSLAQGGDLDALQRLRDVSGTFLDEALAFFPRAGGDYQEIFNRVREALGALGVPAGISPSDGATGGGGGMSTSDLAMLADLITQRDAILAEQQAVQDNRLLSELLTNIRDLRASTGESLDDVFASLGLDPFSVLDRLGIDLGDTGELTNEQLRALSNDLGIEFSELGNLFDLDWGELTDPESRVNRALTGTIDDLPKEIREQLQSLLNDVENAVTAIDSNNAINALQDVVGTLPANLQLLLAPFLPDIDVESPVEPQITELSSLNETQDTALNNLQSIAAVLGARVVNRSDVGPSNRDGQKEFEEDKLSIRATNIAIQEALAKIANDGLPAHEGSDLASEWTLERVALATEATAAAASGGIFSPSRSRLGGGSDLNP